MGFFDKFKKKTEIKQEKASTPISTNNQVILKIPRKQ